MKRDSMQATKHSPHRAKKAKPIAHRPKLKAHRSSLIAHRPSRTALFIGRFQPFHVGHLDAFSRMRAKNAKVKILIGSSNRSRTGENPMTFTERRNYIRSIVGTGISILPLPDNPSDTVWLRNLRRHINKGTVIYSGNDWVLDLCEKGNIRHQLITYYVDISATRIREMISQKNPDYVRFLVNKRLPKTMFEVWCK